MIQFNLTANGLNINGTQYSFPIVKEELINQLGTPTIVTTKYYKIFIWDTIGIRAVSTGNDLIDSIEVMYKVVNQRFATREPFNGQLSMDGESDPILYYKSHENKHIKLIGSDDEAIQFNDVIVHYCILEGDLYSLNITAFKEQNVNTVGVLSVDDGYEYLIEVWGKWKITIEKVVGAGNEYYNPTHGITQAQLDKVTAQLEEEDEEVVLPKVLINFYKAGNVKWNAVTSAIQFSVNGWGYDLLPFEMIYDKWDEVIGLFEEDEEDVEYIESLDPQLKCTGYANPKWIPIAEGKNGDYLLMDTDPSESGTYGQIVELQNEAGVRTVVASNLQELIYREIALLEKGDLEGYEFVINARTV